MTQQKLIKTHQVFSPNGSVRIGSAHLYQEEDSGELSLRWQPLPDYKGPAPELELVQASPWQNPLEYVRITALGVWDRLRRLVGLPGQDVPESSKVPGLVIECWDDGVGRPR